VQAREEFELQPEDFLMKNQSTGAEDAFKQLRADGTASQFKIRKRGSRRPLVTELGRASFIAERNVRFMWSLGGLLNAEWNVRHSKHSNTPILR
jgi:hypothetical protein